MIITRTPFRVSLFGGGTDYPVWFREFGGAVIGAAINKYCYLNIRELPPFFTHRYRIVYSQIELVNEVEEIAHPVVRAALNHGNLPYGVEIHHAGDLPARAGLGSSSAFTVGILHALALLKKETPDKRALADRAIWMEQDELGEAVGCQDQIWAAFGGINRIEFPTDGDYVVRPLALPPARRERLEKSMLLAFSGLSRYAHEIAEKQIAVLTDKARDLNELRGMVDFAETIIDGHADPIGELGRLLTESWKLKRNLHPEITNDQIDALVDLGIKAGAAGAKLLGAGGGGFVLFLCEPERMGDLVRALDRYILVPVGIDDAGSISLVNDPATALDGA